MKLDRNHNSDGLGKYALIKVRELTEAQRNQLLLARNADSTQPFSLNLELMDTQVVVDDFFVLKYADEFTPSALVGYCGELIAEAKNAYMGSYVWNPQKQEYDVAEAPNYERAEKLKIYALELRKEVQRLVDSNYSTKTPD